ncbi:putative sulfate exporter family transporter [Magnetospira thiophila]
MPTVIVGAILFVLGLTGLVNWQWSVQELLRGVVPLGLLLFGLLAVASGLKRIPLASVNGADSPVSPLFRKEDWWAVWLGLTFVLYALATYTTHGDFLKAITVNPGGLKWRTSAELGAHFAENAALYMMQFGVWVTFLGVSCRVMGIPFGRFIAGFSFLYLLSMAIFAVGGWVSATQFNLEPPLVALIVGLILANTVRLPAWMDAAFRVEYFVKLGIVLLGATFPITLVMTAGPVAIGQATVISLLSCLTIYFAATRWFGLDRRLAAVISVGGSVCGVSASMAIAAAVGATKDHVYASVTLVVGWALVMIIALPFVSQALGLHPGVAGAWIGTSEFADAAGFAAAASYGKMAGNEEAALKAFTLMKVIGRDLWIGIWAMVWALVATTVWDKAEKGQRKLDPGEIWRRFPKFVFGFFVASILVTLLTSGFSAAEFEQVVKPNLLAPINSLRSWAFIFCFLSIGLTTRFRDLHAVNFGTFSAFSIGVVVNVIAGFILSVWIFGDYWSRL